MCGRFALGIPKKRLEECFGAPFPDEYTPTYNAAPGRFMPVVGWRSGIRAVRMLRWGLVPSWARDEKIGYRMINARSETAAEKPSFRAAFAKRRCLIPVQGFYEWQRTATGKQPYAFVPRPPARHSEEYSAPTTGVGGQDLVSQAFNISGDERLGRDMPEQESSSPGVLALAGLWEHWTAPDGTDLRTFTILTCEANALMRPVHDRMPVIVEPENWNRWLSGEKTHDLLVPCGEEVLRAYPVSSAINTPANDTPELLKELSR